MSDVGDVGGLGWFFECLWEWVRDLQLASGIPVSPGVACVGLQWCRVPRALGNYLGSQVKVGPGGASQPWLRPAHTCHTSPTHRPLPLTCWGVLVMQVLRVQDLG